MKRKICQAIFAICVLLTLSGCASSDVKKKTKENVKEYEDDFAKKIESELGSDFVLSDVEGYISVWVSDYSLFPQEGVSNQLTGKITKDGKKYDAMYNFETDELYTDYYKYDIIRSLTDTLEMDYSKVSDAVIFNQDAGTFPTLFSADYQDIGSLLNGNKGKHICIYIVTSEDLSDLDIEEYKNLCERKKGEAEVYILMSDDFKNADHFEKNCYGIFDAGGAHPEVDYKGETTDIYTLYNLKNFLLIDTGFDDKIGDIEVIIYE